MSVSCLVDAPCARQFAYQTPAVIVREGVPEQAYFEHDMASVARDLGQVDVAGEVLPPFLWNEDRRLRLRAKLDALYFILFGVFDPALPGHDPAQARDDVRYICSTFPIVEWQETERWARYRSRDLCLAWINALLTGQPDAKVEG